MLWKDVRIAIFSVECNEWGKKEIIHRSKHQILQNVNAFVFITFIESDLNSQKNNNTVSDRWRCGIRSFWHAGDERFEPVYGSFLFVRNPVNAVEEKFPHWKLQILQKFTAKNRKSYKSSPLSSHSSQKDAGALQWKLFF